MRSLDETFEQVFGKPPPAPIRPAGPKVFIVEADHPWLEKRRIEVHATQKGAEIVAAEVANEIRENFLHRFDLCDRTVPAANCTNYSSVLEALYPYDSAAPNAVRVEAVELKLL